MTNTRAGRLGSTLLYSLDGMVPHEVLVILSSFSLCVCFRRPTPFFERLTLDHSCNVSFFTNQLMY